MITCCSAVNSNPTACCWRRSRPETGTDDGLRGLPLSQPRNTTAGRFTRRPAGRGGAGPLAAQEPCLPSRWRRTRSADRRHIGGRSTAVLGKPGREDAVGMLGRLSGRLHHTVVSGVTLRGRADAQLQADFQRMVPHALRRGGDRTYVDGTCRPFRQGSSTAFRSGSATRHPNIEGSFYNVMGLPIQKVYVELDKFLDR